MSNLDYQSGASFGVARARAVSADAQGAISEWQSHAEQLRLKLASASDSAAFADARLAAQTALLKKIEAELQRLCPEHELLQEGVKTRIKVAAMTEALAKSGYQYNPADYTVTKIR